jgi:hypothetical protein
MIHMHYFYVTTKMRCACCLSGRIASLFTKMPRRYLLGNWVAASNGFSATELLRMA